MSNPPAGWYPDPTGQPNTIRWWNGKQWTNRTEKEEPAEQATPEPVETDPTTDPAQSDWSPQSGWTTDPNVPRHTQTAAELADEVSAFERARATWNAPEIAPAPAEHWTQQPVPDAPTDVPAEPAAQQDPQTDRSLKLAPTPADAGDTPDATEPARAALAAASGIAGAGAAAATAAAAGATGGQGWSAVSWTQAPNTALQPTDEPAEVQNLQAWGADGQQIGTIQLNDQPDTRQDGGWGVQPDPDQQAAPNGWGTQETSTQDTGSDAWGTPASGPQLWGVQQNSDQDNPASNWGTQDPAQDNGWGAQQSAGQDTTASAWGSQQEAAPDNGWGSQQNAGSDGWGAQQPAQGGGWGPPQESAQDSNWGAQQSAGEGTAPSAWGSHQEAVPENGRGSQQNVGSDGWGAQPEVAQDNGWGAQQSTGQDAALSAWGSQQETAQGGGWGSQQATGQDAGSGGWGAQQESAQDNGWGAQQSTGQGTASSGWGSQQETAQGGGWGSQQSAGQESGAPWGTQQAGGAIAGQAWGGEQAWQVREAEAGGGRGGNGKGSKKKDAGGGSSAKLPVLIAGGVVLVMLVVAAVFLITSGDDKQAGPNPTPTNQPTGNQPTSQPTGESSTKPGQSKNPKLHEGAGRIASDAVSFPRRLPPWSDRKRLVPQLINSSGQYVLLQENLDGKNDWYADIFVGALGTGSGFNGDPKATAASLSIQLRSSLYGDIPVTFKTVANGAVKRSEKSGWFYQQTVTAKSPKLTARVLTLTVAVFDLGDGTAVAYVSDIPTNRPDLRTAESQAYKGINVG